MLLNRSGEEVILLAAVSNSEHDEEKRWLLVGPEGQGAILAVRSMTHARQAAEWAGLPRGAWVHWDSYTIAAANQLDLPVSIYSREWWN